MNEEQDLKNYSSIRNDNYLVNAYKHLIKAKFVHFIFSLIEIFLNIFQELNIFLYKYDIESKSQNEFLYVLVLFQNKIKELSSFMKMIILLFYAVFFDILYLFFAKRKLKKRYSSFVISFNILEFLHFRVFVLIFLNIFFSLNYTYLISLLLFFYIHIHLIATHFSYNHLYYFVPIFIEYPYDEFTSIYDSFLLPIKLLMSIIINSKISSIKNILYILLFIIQIIFCIYFMKLLLNNSYLFMKNYFLNATKVSLFFTQAFTLVIAELVGKKELLTIWFLIIQIGLLLIFLFIICLIYDPKRYIKINAENHNENLFYYFYIVSEKNELNFLLETKINEHYEKCNICNLCKKFGKYLNFCGVDNMNRNEKENKIYSSNIKEENNFTNLFDVLYDYKNKYFKLINEIILNYKYDRMKYFINSSYYYINLSFLIFSEFKVDNITLSLNIKLLLDIMNTENKFIDKQDLEINQIIFCNNFISLSKNILNQLKNILTENYANLKKFINLSRSLKEMQTPKYKDVLYNYKQDNSSSSKNVIMICSILYEEIFNETINLSQLPLRDNFQALDDMLFNNITKNNRIITLSINLINNNCKIIRAGKGLFKYKDNNFFELFPMTFRDYQVKYFLSKLLDSFNVDSKGIKRIESMKIESIIKRRTQRFVKDNKVITKNKSEFIEIKLIICENIETKLFYRLLILKLTPLFNCDFNSYYLLFDGSFYLYKSTVMTFQNFENRRNINQKIISVSKPELENPPEIYSMKFEKYSHWLDKNGFLLTKIFEYKFSKKTYTVYSLFPKENKNHKKEPRLSFYQRDSIGEIDFSEVKSGLSFKKNKGNAIEENASVVSSQPKSSNYQMAIGGYGTKNKKKLNVYRYSSLYKIKNTLIFSIPVIFLTFILESIHLNRLKDENISNDYSIVKFAEIYKLYFQLFSSTLSTACIKVKDNCTSIASSYKKDYEKFEYFNFSMFFSLQNKLMAKKLLEKKNNLLDIHKNIGNEKYKEIFEDKIDYTRIGKTFIDGKPALSLSKITMPFSEAILIACNSFQIIVNNTKNEPVYILNKNINPFFDLYQEEVQNFSDYQKEISEMILNYKVYKNQFMVINQKFLYTLASQSQTIELFIYLYFTMTLFICIYILSLLYIYLMKFEEIIVKILNYANMVKNFKTDEYNFSILFLQKIENLEIILTIYIDNPINIIQNLNSLYNKYQRLIANIDNNNNESFVNKKKYKKTVKEENEKDDLDMVPMNQRVYKKYDIRKLRVMYTYFLFFIFLCFCLVIMYFIILDIWINYAKAKTNLYSLVSKNLELEVSLYKTINLYDLIIFNNLTIEELSTDIFYDQEKNIHNRETLLNSFYEDLFIAFNYEVEITVLRKSFKSFPFFNYTCKDLYEWNHDYISELLNYSENKNITYIEKNLFDICEFSRLAEFNDMNIVFQNHYGDIKNAIISIVDNSYEGLVNHLKEGKFGRIEIHFNCVLLYLLNIVSNIMHRIEIDDLIILLKENLALTLVVTCLSYLILIILVRWFFIRKLKIYCNQVLLLKKVFKIYEIQEQ